MIFLQLYGPLRLPQGVEQLEANGDSVCYT